MIILKVPYAEKDEAKALGARWNKERKIWYVPDGADGAPFKRWIAPGNAPGAPASSARPERVDSYAGKTSIGANYLVLEHACNPFIACAECRPKLEASGWLAQQAVLKQLLVSLTTLR